MERIADNFAAIRAKLEEIEAAKVKARGDETGGITDQPAEVKAETTFHFYGTPVVNGGCYQAPDDYCGFSVDYARPDGSSHPVYKPIGYYKPPIKSATSEVQWTPSGPYLPDSEPREIAKAMLKLCAPDDFMGYVEIGVMTDFGPTG